MAATRRADDLTFRAGRGSALRGCILQLGMAVALLIYALVAKDRAAINATVFAFAGVAAWLGLTILLDQHRRERIEAMEAAALAEGDSAGSGSSVFSTSAELRPAAARLAGQYKFVMPVLAVLIALALLLFGGWQLYLMQRFGMTELKESFPAPSKGMGFEEPTRPAWAIGLGVVCALIGFVYARYTAGMSKQPAWVNLRAGAAFSAGTAILGLGLAVVNIIKYLGPDLPQRWFQVVAAGLLVLTGIEIVLNLLLQAYRPRRAGETPRVAFDSRLLGLIAAPDRVAASIGEAINYQLGFNVTSGWFYRLLTKTLLPLVLVGLLIMWVLSAFVVLQPHQRGTILRFGKPLRDIGPGLTLKMPWPVDSVYIPEFFERGELGVPRVADRTVTGLRTIQIGTTPKPQTQAILWTDDHAGDEVPQYVRASSAAKPAAAAKAQPTDGTPAGDTLLEAAGIAKLRSSELADLAIINAEIPLQYTITDVNAYDRLAPPLQRDNLLKAVAVREATLYFQDVNLDEALGHGRRAISEGLRDRVQARFDALNPGPDGKPMGAGVKVVFVGISGVHPPKPTASAFELPVQADARRIANIDTAKADAVASLVKAAGEASLARKIIEEMNAKDELTAKKADAKLIAAKEDAIARAIEGAGGEAASLLAKARAERWQKHMAMRGRAMRFVGQAKIHDAAPELYRTQQWLDAVTDMLEGAKILIVGGDTGQRRIEVNLEEADLGVDPFLNKQEGE